MKERHGQALKRARRMADADIPFSAKENIEKAVCRRQGKPCRAEERASELKSLNAICSVKKAAGAIAAEYASDSAKLEKLLENKDYIDLKRDSLRHTTRLVSLSQGCAVWTRRSKRLKLSKKTASVKRRNRLAGRRICFDNGAACVQAGAGGFPYRQKVPYGKSPLTNKKGGGAEKAQQRAYRKHGQAQRAA